MSSFKTNYKKRNPTRNQGCCFHTFNVPEELKSKYAFIAGQYLNCLTLDGKEIRRAYSICSSPESGELRIAVKAVKNGVFSQFANTKLKVGQALEVGEPEGKYI
jgi:ring-1,2-phenylacetyl-CoA epoxidase subunit PaaE